MKEISVTYSLTSDQAGKLDALTALYNERAKAKQTPEEFFKSIMLAGSALVIDERLKQTAQLLGNGGAHETH